MGQDCEGRHESGGGGCCRGQSRGGPEREELTGEAHLKHAAELWERAFWQALHETRVELIKEKLKASWRGGMEATAASVVETMHADWKKFQEEEAKREKPEESSPRDVIVRRLKEGLKAGPQ